MKSLKIPSLILVISLTLTLWPGISPVHAQGNTYTVDPGGSDTTGDGSAGQPWQTIQYAANQVQAGDTVLINPGTYAGGITVDTAGTASLPITFRGNGPGVVIEGSGGKNDAFFISQADYIVVEELTIQHANRAGLRISLSDHVTIRHSTFGDNGRWGVFTDFSDHTLIENSEMFGSVDEHGIYISNSSDYPTIRGNRLHHNHANGLHMNGDISQGGDGIISFGLIENNIIYENGVGGGSGINMDGVTDTLVRNNLLYDNHASGISIYQIDGGSGSQNNRILNNTILMPSDGRWAINIPNSNDTGNQLFNNILFTEHSFRGVIVIPEANLAGFQSDYNVVLDRFSPDGDSTILDLAAWQMLGYDAHSLVSSPAQVFVDPAAKDFRLKAGSPAIDAGANLPDVPTDLAGNPRPAGSAFDVGAYEFTPALTLSSAVNDQTIRLTWSVNTTLPATSTWQLSYSGPTGDQPSPITGLISPTRAYTLTGLTNYTPYAITLKATLGSTPILTDSITLTPTDIFIYLPLVRK